MRVWAISSLNNLSLKFFLPFQLRQSLGDGKWQELSHPKENSKLGLIDLLRGNSNRVQGQLTRKSPFEGKDGIRALALPGSQDFISLFCD